MESGLSPRELPTADRGIWIPSKPVAIVAMIVLALSITGICLSIGSMDIFDAELEVTTESEQSVHSEEQTLVVTILEEQSRNPVSGATVVPVPGDTRIDSAPTMTTDEAGVAIFEVGSGDREIVLDWTAGRDFAEIGFEVEPPGDRFVDVESNPTLRIRRS